MPYRDDREALRACNEDLQGELAALRAQLEPPPKRRRRNARRVLRVLVPVAGLCGLIAASAPSPPSPAPEAVAPYPEAPARSASPLRVSPGLHPLAELATAASGPMESIHRVYSGHVTHASANAPVAEATSCTVGVRRAGEICLVSTSCGGWSPFPGGAVAACTIDERGFPRGGVHMGSGTGQPTQIEMDGQRYELADERPGKAYLLTVRLDDVRPG